MNKFIKIAARVSSRDIKSDLLRILDLFRAGCGEKIPLLPDALEMKAMGDGEIRDLLRSQSSSVLDKMRSYPAYPCVFEVISFVKENAK